MIPVQFLIPFNPGQAQPQAVSNTEKAGTKEKELDERFKEIEIEIVDLSSKEPSIISQQKDEEKGEQKLDRQETSTQQKKSRWKRKDDIRLFKAIESLCIETRDTVPDILDREYNYEESDSFWKGIAKKVKWLGTYYSLYCRFKLL